MHRRSGLAGLCQLLLTKCIEFSVKPQPLDLWVDSQAFCPAPGEGLLDRVQRTW